MIRAIRAVAIAVALVVVVAACAGAWLVYGDRSLPAEASDVIVAKGSGIAAISAQLGQAGIVRSATLFRLYLRAARPAISVEAAEYSFAPHETMRDVASTLAAGGRPVVVWVTIPEGFTARQIAQRLAERGLFPAADFLRVAYGTSIEIGGARTKNLEGYLFPDTYAVPRDAAPEAVAAIMSAQFQKELPRDFRSAAKRQRMSVPQIITVASLIEAEAKVDSERALMAGVYYNRLRKGMPLEVDATIEYALPAHKAALSFGDLAIDSPYNTYKHVGLPPTPIANPGRASIDAAFHPRQSDYFYYVYMGNGHHKFSRTLAEQQRAEQEYLR